MSAGVAYEPPQGEIEEKLAAIWSEVLGVDQIGRQDNFFSLGGHSLTLIALTGKVLKAFSVQLSVREAFQLAEFVSLAKRIENELNADSKDADLNEMAELLSDLES